MPPLSRRALLATVSAGAVGSVAGCTDPLANLRADEPRPQTIDGRAIYLADGVQFPAVDGVALVDDPADADVAVFPADGPRDDAEDARDAVISALDADAAAVVAGEDAQLALMRACRADGRSYGFARDGWGPNTRVVAAVPGDDVLETHLFVGAQPPADLPWAIGEVLSPPERECTVPPGSSVVPGDVAEAATPVGASRIRGRNEVAGFDRWDRVRLADDGDRVGVVVDQAATILAGSEDDGDRRYRADGVRLAVDFDHALAGSGPEPASGGPVEVSDGSDASEGDDDGAEGAVEREYAPANDGARRSFTACQRAYVTAPEPPDPFTYIANARFRWRDARLLDDDTWHHHTPGQATWYPRS